MYITFREFYCQDLMAFIFKTQFKYIWHFKVLTKDIFFSVLYEKLQLQLMVVGGKTLSYIEKMVLFKPKDMQQCSALVD